MSTYYYLVCREHKEHVYSGKGRGHGAPLADRFVAAHDGCTLESHNEHWMWCEANDAFFESLTEWTTENADALEEALWARRDGSV